MSIIDSLEDYTASQKLLAYRFMAFGVILAMVALAVFFTASNSLMFGIQYAAALWSLLILVGGFSYLRFSNKTHQRLVVAHAEDATKMLVDEKKRMHKVVDEFPIYQTVFITFIAASLALTVFGSGIYRGVGLVTGLLYVCVLLTEMQSKRAIDQHHHNLQRL